MLIHIRIYAGIQVIQRTLTSQNLQYNFSEFPLGKLDFLLPIAMV